MSDTCKIIISVLSAIVLACLAFFGAILWAIHEDAKEKKIDRTDHSLERVWEEFKEE